MLPSTPRRSPPGSRSAPSRRRRRSRCWTTATRCPFIARYRKEQTGGLDEDQLRRLIEALATLRALDERRATIIAAIEEQGNLTPALRGRHCGGETRTALEDLYPPYKPQAPHPRQHRARARPRAAGRPDRSPAAHPPDAEQLARPFLGERRRDGRGGAGRRARHRRRDDQRPPRCAADDPRTGAALGDAAMREDRRGRGPARRLPDLLRLRGADRPAQALSGAGDQSGRDREGAAGEGRRGRARLAAADRRHVPPRPSLAAGRPAGAGDRRRRRAPAAAGHRARCAPPPERAAPRRTPSTSSPPTCAAC